MSNEERRVGITLYAGDRNASTKALSAILEQGRSPREVVQELLAIFYGPLAMSEGEELSLIAQLEMRKAIYALVAQIQQIQETHSVWLVDIQFRQDNLLRLNSEGSVRDLAWNDMTTENNSKPGAYLGQVF